MKLMLESKEPKALYSLDKANKIRVSHENPVVKEVYKEFLETPLWT